MSKVVEQAYQDVVVLPVKPKPAPKWSDRMNSTLFRLVAFYFVLPLIIWLLFVSGVVKPTCKTDEWPIWNTFMFLLCVLNCLWRDKTGISDLFLDFGLSIFFSRDVLSSAAHFAGAECAK
jgi:hypothetical protein